MQTLTHGHGESETVGESEKLLPLPKLVHVVQDTGQLVDSVADQYEKLGSDLTSLPRQEGFVRVRGGKALRFRTADVPDAFASPEAQMKAVAWIKRRLQQTHDYYFTPSVEEDLPDPAADLTAEGTDADGPAHAEDAEELEESPLL